ncbi:MAG: sulfurtransferase [Candidatus Promineifilaceae bacterium]|nr:sulfurtransferase [Candidatus Promineifilaceae bacterium]
MENEVTYSAVIDCKTLFNRMEQQNWVIVDCRYSLADTTYGFQSYQTAHIPGAVYAHLDQDLCGPPLTDHGRHPLPSTEAMSALFGRLGIGNEVQVVVYDDANGSFASRLWWMLRYMGHASVAVLDGGWQAWQRAGYPTRSGLEKNELVKFVGTSRREKLVLIDEIADLPMLIDSRAPERHRGEIEALDPQAGHIPGSANYFYQNNWDSNGLFLSPEVLKARFIRLFGSNDSEQVTFYCGSGVTACVNLVAVEHAGLGSANLYVGSWSEWCRDPERPIATGG